MKRPLQISATLLGALALAWWAWPSSSPTAGKTAAPAPAPVASATSAVDVAAEATEPAPPVTSTEATDPDSPTAAANSNAVPIPVRRLAIAEALAAWQKSANFATARADPFADEALSVIRATAGTALPDPPALVVQGISINGARAFAVINRKVVTAGDTIGNWRVESILPDTVWVRSVAAGRQGLQLSRSAVVAPEATPGATSARDLPLAAVVTELISHLPAPSPSPSPTQGSE